jgi:hypothetical protein
MGVVYSMYDALVSINVPTEKAKAVIDAMEREMMDKVATKTDLDHFMKMTKSDLEHVRELLSKDIQNLSNAMTVKLGTMLAGSVVLTCSIVGTMILAFH